MECPMCRNNAEKWEYFPEKKVMFLPINGDVTTYWEQEKRCANPACGFVAKMRRVKEEKTDA